MAVKIVVDTSVLVKWIKTKDERLLEEARHLLHQIEAKPLNVHVPALLLYEVGNILLLKLTSMRTVWIKPSRTWKRCRSSSLRPRPLSSSAQRESASNLSSHFMTPLSWHSPRNSIAH